MVSGKKICKLVQKYVRLDQQPVQFVDGVGWIKAEGPVAAHSNTRRGCCGRSAAMASGTYSVCSTTGCAWADDIAPADVPEGCLAVYVGPEMRRFVIQTELLYKRAFRELLRKSEEEYGFESAGGLRIACEAALFENLLWQLQSEADR